jgi:hypothetical protein
MKKAAVSSILVAVVLLAVGVTAEAQETGKIFRIGFLDNGTASGNAVRPEPMGAIIFQLYFNSQSCNIAI